MMGGGMMGGGGFGPAFGGFGLWGGLIGLLFNLAILVGIVLLVIWAVQRLNRSANSVAPTISPNGSGTGQSGSAHEILKVRYARGELTRDEYQTMLNDVS